LDWGGGDLRRPNTIAGRGPRSAIKKKGIFLNAQGSKGRAEGEAQVNDIGSKHEDGMAASRIRDVSKHRYSGAWGRGAFLGGGGGKEVRHG